MQIAIESNACILNIPCDSIHARAIEHFVEKNFKRVLRFTNSRLVFTSKSESVKRNYFLDWAYQVYCKSNLPSASLQSRLKAAQNLPIKIVLISKKSLAQHLNIHVERHEGNKVALRIDKRHSQLHLYLRMRFARLYRQSLPNKTGVIIEITDKTALTKLKKLLSSKFIVGFSIRFVYSEQQINEMGTESRRTHMEEAYTVLQLRPGASHSEIRANYRKLLRQYHPDRVFTHDKQTVSLYTERFQRIQNAYELIREESA